MYFARSAEALCVASNKLADLCRGFLGHDTRNSTKTFLNQTAVPIAANAYPMISRKSFSTFSPAVAEACESWLRNSCKILRQCSFSAENLRLNESFRLTSAAMPFRIG